MPGPASIETPLSSPFKEDAFDAHAWLEQLADPDQAQGTQFSSGKKISLQTSQNVPSEPPFRPIATHILEPVSCRVETRPVARIAGSPPRTLLARHLSEVAAETRAQEEVPRASSLGSTQVLAKTIMAVPDPKSVGCGSVWLV